MSQFKPRETGLYRRAGQTAFAPDTSRAEAVAKVTPDFPERPTSREIEAEYTPDRVLRLCRYVAGRVTNGSATKDEFDEAVQDASLSFYKRVKQYNEGAELPESYPFYYWLLFRMITDVREIRYREKRRLGERSMNQLSVVPVEPKAATASVQDEVINRLSLHEAIMQLTPRQQQVVQMYYFEHQTQVQVANALGITQPNVNKLLKRAQDKLRGILE